MNEYISTDLVTSPFNQGGQPDIAEISPTLDHSPDDGECLSRYQRLFAGRTEAWGKVEGCCVKERITEEHYAKHLGGITSLGIYPSVGDKLKFAVLDIDFPYPKSPNPAVAKHIHSELQRLGVTSWIEVSKGKGYHIWIFFTDWVPAWKIRIILWHLASEARKTFPKANFEIFPKQDRIKADGYGNYINLPYFGHEQSLKTESPRRVIIDPTADRPLSLSEFLEAAETCLNNEEVLDGIVSENDLENKNDPGHKSGNRTPITERLLPCGQEITRRGLKEGSRNEAILRLATTHRISGLDRGKSQEICLNLNADCTTPLLPEEVNRTVESAYKPEIPYWPKCDDTLLQEYCKPDWCEIKLEKIQEKITGVITAKKTPGILLKRRSSKIIRDGLRDRGELIVDQNRDVYFKAREIPKLMRIDQERFSTLVHHSFGLNPSDRAFWEFMIAEISTYARTASEPREVRLVSHFDQRQGVLYVSRFDGSVYRLDGERIQLISNGEEGVLFADDPDWESYQYIEGRDPQRMFDQTLVDPICLDEDSALTIPEYRIILKTAILGMLLPELQPTKIVICVVGPRGAGKSLTLRKIIKVILGSKVELIPIIRDKEDAFIAAVTNSPVAFFDNVDMGSLWLNDQLAFAATGGSYNLRRLYTTNESIRIYARAFIGISARTPKFRREDVAQRLLIIPCKELKGNQEIRPENLILRETMERRNIIWTEMLLILNRVVARIKSGVNVQPSEFRMADYAYLGQLIADELGEGETFRTGITKMSQAQETFYIEEDPVASLIERWAREEHEISGLSANQLWLKLEGYATTKHIKLPIKNGRALAQWLARSQEALQTIGITIERQEGRARVAEYLIEIEGRDSSKEPSDESPSKEHSCGLASEEFSDLDSVPDLEEHGKPSEPSDFYEEPEE